MTKRLNATAAPFIPQVQENSIPKDPQKRIRFILNSIDKDSAISKGDELVKTLQDIERSNGDVLNMLVEPILNSARCKFKFSEPNIPSFNEISYLCVRVDQELKEKGVVSAILEHCLKEIEKYKNFENNLEKEYIFLGPIALLADLASKIDQLRETLCKDPVVHEVLNLSGRREKHLVFCALLMYEKIAIGLEENLRKKIENSFKNNKTSNFISAQIQRVLDTATDCDVKIEGDLSRDTSSDEEGSETTSQHNSTDSDSEKKSSTSTKPNYELKPSQPNPGAKPFIPGNYLRHTPNSLNNISSNQVNSDEEGSEINSGSDCESPKPSQPNELCLPPKPETSEKQAQRKEKRSENHPEETKKKTPTTSSFLADLSDILKSHKIDQISEWMSEFQKYIKFMEKSELADGNFGRMIAVYLLELSIVITRNCDGKLLKDLCNICVDIDKTQSEKVALCEKRFRFRPIMLSVCQSQYDKSYLLLLDENEKRRVIGVTKFIAGLHDVDFLYAPIIVDEIKALLNKDYINETRLECAVVLLRDSFDKLDKSVRNEKSLLDSYDQLKAYLYTPQRNANLKKEIEQLILKREKWMSLVQQESPAVSTSMERKSSNKTNVNTTTTKSKHPNETITKETVQQPRTRPNKK